jgi:protein-S-isoprenylcysteine O-methyltransferase Ste14
MHHVTGIFILICFIVFLLFWIVSARSAKPAIEKRGFGWARWFLVIAIICLILLRVTGIVHIPGSPLWHRTLITKLTADFVTLIGLAITIWARIILGGNWSANVEFKKDHELIERGPYAKLRHPIYTGMLLMFLGLAIYHASLASIALFAAIFILFWVKANSEEKLMTEHFPEEYPSYKARTWRLIPFVL